MVEARTGEGGLCSVGGVTSEWRMEVKMEFACSMTRLVMVQWLERE